VLGRDPPLPFVVSPSTPPKLGRVFLESLGRMELPWLMAEGGFGRAEKRRNGGVCRDSNVKAVVVSRISFG
jgi:hypothetical protein